LIALISCNFIPIHKKEKDRKNRRGGGGRGRRGNTKKQYNDNLTNGYYYDNKICGNQII